MKKLRSIIIAVSVLVIICVAAAIGVYYSSGNGREITTDISNQVVMDEYLIETTNEISPERINSVWIKDGTDGLFTAEDEDFQRSLAVIKQSIFDEVYVFVPFSGEDSGEESLARLDFALSSVQELNIKAYAAFDIALEEAKIAEYGKNADGIILMGAEGLTAEEINLKASEVKRLSENKSIIICLSLDFKELDKLENAYIDAVQFTLSNKQDSEKLQSISDELEIICCLDISAVDGKNVMAVEPLEALYALKDEKRVSRVSFDSLKSTRTNFHNCFGAVKTYITSGIAPEVAFREVAVLGYDGNKVTAPGYTAQINIYGSYLFPFFVDGKNIGSSANGNISATVDLMPGENTFTVSQNSSKLEYQIESSCEGDIVTYIVPNEDIYVLPSESFNVVVIAHCNAEIYIRIGKDEIKAECESSATGFTAFSAAVTAPKSEEEIKSLGSMSVVAVFGEKAVQLEGAKIFLAGSADESTAQSTTLEAGNYIPTVSTQAPTQNNPSPGQNITYTGNLMCVVKEPYADTKFISSDDNYSPSCSPLVGGTMDYVIAESTGYNSDEDTTEYYYDLASGMRVKRDMVDLVSVTGLNDNSIEVLSVTDGLGKLQITLKTDWKVPYNIDYPGQNYYYSYNKYFNVTSFNASMVRMTFYHTASVKGNVDMKGESVLSSAGWSTSPSNKTATLTLNLKNPGEYYGSSLEYDANGNMVITINRKPEASQGYVVLLDPGHGGAEPGAVGLDSAVQERYINLAFAYQVKAELEKKGVTVYMTRTGNDKNTDTLSLEQRKEITRKIKPDLYVSIHCNGSYNSESIGTSTYYYEPFSYNLAKNIYNELLSVHKNYLYAGRQELYSQLADNVQFYPFSVTRIEDCPSTLIEVGYLTNDAECAMLAQPENQERFGKAIADGIYKTLTS